MNPDPEMDFHDLEPTPEGRIFKWDPKFKRQASPVVCKNCGRKGAAIIYEWEVSWE